TNSWKTQGIDVQVLFEIRIARRARTTGAQSSPPLSSGSNNFNSRRRDIFTDNRSQRSESNHDPSARSKVLLPDLDSKGRPTCLSSPDDTYCESVQNYPKIFYILEKNLLFIIPCSFRLLSQP
ncbi:unnamed protein product, partial [Oppiella nova]